MPPEQQKISKTIADGLGVTEDDMKLAGSASLGLRLFDKQQQSGYLAGLRRVYEKYGLENPEARSAETKAAGLVKGETACNRSACQAPLDMGKRWWNTGTNAWYCMRCARRINDCETICFLEGTANAAK